MEAYPTNGHSQKILDQFGKPILREMTPDGFAIPEPWTFEAEYMGFNQTYLMRSWCEALRHSHENAMAMLRDDFIISLLGERTRAKLALSWHITSDDPKNPVHKYVCDAIEKILRQTPNLTRAFNSLYWADWYGRSGLALKWQWRDVDITAIDGIQVDTIRALCLADHREINGDKITFQYDGTPCVRFLNQKQEQIPNSQWVYTNEGVAMRISGTFREQAIFHHHDCQDQDFYEAEKAAGIYGVGIRSRVYWDWYKRKEYESWISDTLEDLGLGQLLLYYELNNAESREKTLEASKRRGRKSKIVLPRSMDGRLGGGKMAEMLEAPTNGIAFVLELIDRCERRIERMIVGQEGSASATSTSGHSNIGSNDFMMQTKRDITVQGAQELAETLTGCDDKPGLVSIIKRWTFPWARFPVRLEFQIPDADRGMKLQAGVTLVQLGVPVKVNELREAGGYTEPTSDDETIGGLQPTNPNETTAPNANGDTEEVPEEDDGNRSEEPDAGDDGEDARIEQIRKMYMMGLTQAQIADKVGMARSNIGYIVRGDTHQYAEEYMETPKPKMDLGGKFNVPDPAKHDPGLQSPKMDLGAKFNVPNPPKPLVKTQGHGPAPLNYGLMKHHIGTGFELMHRPEQFIGNEQGQKSGMLRQYLADLAKHGNEHAYQVARQLGAVVHPAMTAEESTRAISGHIHAAVGSEVKHPDIDTNGGTWKQVVEGKEPGSKDIVFWHRGANSPWVKERGDERTPAEHGPFHEMVNEGRADELRSGVLEQMRKAQGFEKDATNEEAAFADSSPESTSEDIEPWSEEKDARERQTDAEREGEVAPEIDAPGNESADEPWKDDIKPSTGEGEKSTQLDSQGSRNTRLEGGNTSKENLEQHGDALKDVPRATKPTSRDRERGPSKDRGEASVDSMMERLFNESPEPDSFQGIRSDLESTDPDEQQRGRAKLDELYPHVAPGNRAKRFEAEVAMNDAPVQETPADKSEWQKAFPGEKAPPMRDIRDLAGRFGDFGGHGGSVAWSVTPHGAKHKVKIETQNPVFQSVRYLGTDDQGNKFIANGRLQVDPKYQGLGIGTEIFANQVAKAQKAGYSYIVATGAGRGGEKGDRGYRELPKMGYDGELTPAHRSVLPKEFRGAKTVQELYAMPGGADAWAAFGSPISLKFDLTEGSKSLKILNDYLKSKGRP